MRTNKKQLLAAGVLLSFLAAQAAMAADSGAKPAAKVEAKAAAKAEPAAKKEVAPASQPASQPVSKLTPTENIPKDIDPDDPISLLKGLVKAAKGGQWALLAGLCLMILTWIVDRLLKSKIPPKVLPWLSIGLGVAAQVALTLAAGDIKSADTWIAAVCGGITLGLAGAGGYSALGKYVGLKKKKVVAPKAAEGDS